MTKKIFIELIALGIALAIALAFAGGWLSANWYAVSNPPSFEILDNHKDEVSLIKLKSFDGKLIEGFYEGDQPRFLLGIDEELFLPNEDKTFQLDLDKLKKSK